MKPKDLRLGNLFTEKYSSETIEVIGLSDTVITFSGDYSMWQYQPILLTKEWLSSNIKEIEVEGYSMYILIEGSVSLEIYSDCIVLLFGLNEVRFENIKFVHQLQNLVFGLTNRELETV